MQFHVVHAELVRCESHRGSPWFSVVLRGSVSPCKTILGKQGPMRSGWFQENASRRVVAIPEALEWTIGVTPPADQVVQ